MSGPWEKYQKQSKQNVTLDFSKAEPIDAETGPWTKYAANPVTLDFSKAQPIDDSTPSQPEPPPLSAEEAGVKDRSGALAALTGLTPNMSADEKESFESGKAVGHVAGVATAGAVVTPALVP